MLVLLSKKAEYQQKVPTIELDVTAGIEPERTMNQGKTKARQRLTNVDGLWF